MIPTVSRDELRAFHLTGKGLDALRPNGLTRPALLDDIELPHLERHYPLLLANGSIRPLYEVLKQTAEASPERFPALGNKLEVVADALQEQLAESGGAPVDSLSETALTVESDAAKAEWAALRQSLPHSGRLIGFGEQAPVILSCALLSEARAEARAAFRLELEQTAQRLRELLAADRGNCSESSVGESLGESAGVYLRPSALADALNRRANPVRALEPERRARCENALAEIHSAIARLDKLPLVFLVHSGAAPALPAEFGVALRSAPDADVAFDLALNLSREHLQQFTSTWKALRLARMEANLSFDPAIHQVALDAFDWSMAHANELASVPAVVVAPGHAQLEASLAALSRLLRSGLPVEALITFRQSCTDPLPDLPVAYRDSFTLSSSIADPAHLAAGLAEMSRTFAPAVAFVSTDDSWEAAVVAILGRCCPLYRYNPALGEGWRQRFKLETECAKRYPNLSPAHAFACAREFRDSLRILRTDFHEVEHTELVEYGAPPPPHAIPYLPLDAAGGSARAIFTRELAARCSRAESRWRFLSELASLRTTGQADPEAENRARLDGAQQAIHMAIAYLSNPETLG